MDEQISLLLMDRECNFVFFIYVGYNRYFVKNALYLQEIKDWYMIKEKIERTMDRKTLVTH